MADQGGNGSTSLMREYRKGNWTVAETMILIEAKKMDDERRMKRSTSSGESTEGRSKPAELRWKWVEDYCFRKGCLRSQNQCNDKWDNLMRDYKKVRDYERRVAEKTQGIEGKEESYWKIEKNERKDKNLPTNMLPQIYEALVDVVEKKGQRVLGAGASAGSGAGAGASAGGGGGALLVPSSSPGYQHYQHQQAPQLGVSLLQHHVSAPPVVALSLPAPPPLLLSPPSASPPLQPQPLLPPPPPPPYSHPLPTMCDSSDSDTSEHSDTPAKRRRKAREEHHHLLHPQTTSASAGEGEGPSQSNSSNEVATAISKSASVIAEALQACEEREERRHRDLLSLHERRLKIEESKTEINKQGLNGLVEAINKLANSIQALASDKGQSSSSAAKPS